MPVLRELQMRPSGVRSVVLLLMLLAVLQRLEPDAAAQRTVSSNKLVFGATLFGSFSDLRGGEGKNEEEEILGVTSEGNQAKLHRPGSRTSTPKEDFKPFLRLQSGVLISNIDSSEATLPMLVVERRPSPGATPPTALVDWRSSRCRCFLWSNGNPSISSRPLSLKGGSGSSSRRLWCSAMEASSSQVASSPEAARCSCGSCFGPDCVLH